MEKITVWGVAYIATLILITMFKKKDALIYDFMLISCMYAMTFIIVWFMF